MCVSEIYCEKKAIKFYLKRNEVETRIRRKKKKRKQKNSFAEIDFLIKYSQRVFGSFSDASNRLERVNLNL
jgi:hypothetical protein